MKRLRNMPFDTWICILLAVGVTYGLGNVLKTRMPELGEGAILLFQAACMGISYALFHALGAMAGLFPGYFSKKKKEKK